MDSIASAMRGTQEGISGAKVVDLKTKTYGMSNTHRDQALGRGMDFAHSLLNEATAASSKVKDQRAFFAGVVNVFVGALTSTIGGEATIEELLVIADVLRSGEQVPQREASDDPSAWRKACDYGCAFAESFLKASMDASDQTTDPGAFYVGVVRTFAGTLAVHGTEAAIQQIGVQAHAVEAATKNDPLDGRLAGVWRSIST